MTAETWESVEDINPWDVEGTILHVGPFNDYLMSEYLASPAERIIVVDGDPHGIQAVEERAHQDKRVQILQRILYHEDSQAKFYIYSRESFNGLKSPEEVTKKYPGLHLRKEIRVEACRVRTLFDEASIRVTSPNCMVLNGIEAVRQMVEQFDELEDLAIISLIIIGNDNVIIQLGENGTLERLSESGFSVTRIFSLPDSTAIVAVPSPIIRRLRASLDTMRAQRDEAHERVTKSEREFKARLDALKTEQQASLAKASEHPGHLVQELKKGLEELKSGHRDELGKLKEEHQHQVADAKRALEETQQQLERKVQDAKKTNQRKEVLAKQNGDLRLKNRRLVLAEADLQKRHSVMADQLSKAEVQLELLREISRI